jgi:HD-GYP domain-containing protein (c-di-GMP phosphodiesterase class II)
MGARGLSNNTDAQAAHAAELLRNAHDHERSARVAQAINCFEEAIAASEQCGEPAVLAVALRRLAVIRHQRNEAAPARALAERSYDVARSAGLNGLAAEALNTIGVQDLLAGSLATARLTFARALALGRDSRELRARVEQNLGIAANIQGDHDRALEHYGRSLEAYQASGDEHGCAIAYHNLGMVTADQEQYDEAECHFEACRAIAERVGDAQLQAQGLVSHAEVDIARQRFENARQKAEESLAVFDRLGVKRGKADAYRVIGMVYREVGRPALAESRLTSAIDLAISAGAVLIEAEASRELAILYQAMGRNQEALSRLNRAHELFRRLNARADLVNVGGKMAELEGTYLAVVRAWGQSIESNDSATFGHCERVARHAVGMARALDFDASAETTLLLGAYLHDVGMVRVPHEILRKRSALTSDETRVLEMHPSWGIELLADVEFPWAIKPIVRWHHERCDGSGYPDGLTGERIPIAAQIVGILDVYDGLITARFGQPALDAVDAAWHIVQHRSWWSAPVIDAFMKVIP